MSEGFDLLFNTCFIESGEEGFPCNVDPFVTASLGLAAGAVALMMVLYLLRKVRFRS
jgi:hypothetical protein